MRLNLTRFNDWKRVKSSNLKNMTNRIFCEKFFLIEVIK